MQIHPSVALIQNALAYASFPHSQVRSELDSYLKTLGSDLIEADYTQSEEVDQGVIDLNEVLNDIDSAKLKTVTAIEGANEDDDYDKEVEKDN